MNRNLENAVVRLLKRSPFYGRMILHFRREEGSGSPPLGVTLREGVPTLSVSPAPFAELAPREQEALIEHGLKHVLHLHMTRRKGRNSHDWDIACDLAINPEIDALPPEAPLPS